ncbi:MAG: hypothetical protein GYB49_05515 [Alphaproteobacteria bacterium]|jgi:hypothetical protein|nr:hypothetical protein [Alphaproteobacteria bacterium]|tara:strand:- start:4584 stop:5030 length:447 start_codon:yes stop_codon:yes gene_type:complete
MKPILITAAAIFALSPMALAQDGHKTHDHSETPAVEAEADAAEAKTCMAGHEGMEDCMANMEDKMADGHMMDHSGDHMMDGDKPMMGEGGMAMDKMTEHGADGHKMHDASGEHPMSAEDCQAKHEAMGHDPAEHCPMMTGDTEEAATE